VSVLPVEEANMRERRLAKLNRKRYLTLVILLPVLLLPSTALADPPSATPPASPPTIGATGVPTAPALATHELGNGTAPARRREFYESGWFWGALGAAAFVGTVIFFATRDNGASAIHLHVEVPH
jgi:hypothetical protein